VNSDARDRPGQSATARAGRPGAWPHCSSAVALFGSIAVCLLAFAGLVATAAAAPVALIEIGVPIEDATDEMAVRRALTQALGRLQEGARAMGLPSLHLIGANIGDGQLWVRVLASDAMIADAFAEPAVRGSAARDRGGSPFETPVTVARPGRIPRDPFPGE
jgi:hypothetical protein